ncbi:hypothetical protein FS842_003361 [Serendipita sp. 407]|nr:hypothetical protein FS842_003361 [Serendipita sp. 407]
MSEEDCRVLPLTYYCYQRISSNLDGSSSLGHLPYRLVKPILQNCDPEVLRQLEHDYDDWQKREYLDQTDVEIWRVRCLELLGTEGISLYASSDREVPKSWRREYFALSRERQTAVTRASDRVSKFRVARETDQRKAKLVEELPPTRRRGLNPLHAISNPTFRKVVAQTQKMSLATSMTSNHFHSVQTPPRPLNTMPIRNSPNRVNAALMGTSGPGPVSPPSTRSSSSSLFIPKKRP